MQEGLEQDLSGKNSIIGRTLVIFTADVNGEFNEDVDEPRGCCVIGYDQAPAETADETDHHHHDDHYGSGYATAPAATAAGTNHYHSYQPSSSAYGGYTGHGSAQSSGQNYW